MNCLSHMRVLVGPYFKIFDNCIKYVGLFYLHQRIWDVQIRSENGPWVCLLVLISFVSISLTCQETVSITTQLCKILRHGSIYLTHWIFSFRQIFVNHLYVCIFSSILKDMEKTLHLLEFAAIACKFLNHCISTFKSS